MASASASRPCESHSHDDSINNEPQHYQQQQHLTKDDQMMHDDTYNASLQPCNKHLLESEEERMLLFDFVCRAVWKNYFLRTTNTGSIIAQEGAA